MRSSALPLSVETVSEPTQPAAFAGPILEGDEVRRETHRRVVSALARINFLCVTLLVWHLPLLGFAESKNRIICREELSVARREILAEKLRGITGLPVAFDANGALRLASSVAHGGSEAARNLLSKALAGANVIILDDASERQDVVFSRVVAAKWKHHASELPLTFVIQIDFADFDHLMGDREALKAFNAGWAFLHELDHVVNDSADAVAANTPGDCEDHINVMRKECHLPLRADYFFTFFPYAQHTDFRTRFVRLAFDQMDATTKKHRRYWVIWDARAVGGVPPEIATRR